MKKKVTDQRPWQWLSILQLLLFALAPASLFACGSPSPAVSSMTAVTHDTRLASSEDGIQQAKPHAISSATLGARPKRPVPPGPAPAGMVWIPAGEFWMGSDKPEFPDARPWHRVQLSGYWIDKALATNAQFARFVAATDYVTVAERKPRAEDFPNAPPEVLVSGLRRLHPAHAPCSPGQRYAMVELCTRR